MKKFLIIGSEDDLPCYEFLDLVWSRAGDAWIGAKEVDLEHRYPQAHQNKRFVHRDPTMPLLWGRRTGVVITNWLPWLLRVSNSRKGNPIAVDAWIEMRTDYPFDFQKDVRRIPCFSSFAVSRTGIEIGSYNIPRPRLICDQALALARLRTSISSQLPKNEKVAVAISGGVDSAVVAALLKENGNEVWGFSMSSTIIGTDERHHVQQTCTALAIPLVEFPIDDIPVFWSADVMEPYWGPQNLPTEVHETRFFAFVKSHGFDEIWTGLGGDQLMYGNQFALSTVFGTLPASRRQWASYLKMPHLEVGSDLFRRWDWDLAFRGIHRNLNGHGLAIKAPLIAADVVENVARMDLKLLLSPDRDKPLLRYLLEDLIGPSISTKTKVATMTPTIIHRLENLHGVDIQQPYVQSWRKLSAQEWKRHGQAI